MCPRPPISVLGHLEGDHVLVCCRLLSSPEFEGSEPRAVLPVPQSKEPEYLLCFTRYFLFLLFAFFPRKRLKNKQLCFPGFFVVQQITLWVTVITYFLLLFQCMIYDCYFRHILFVDGYGQQTRELMRFQRLPMEHRLLGRSVKPT